MQHRKQSLSLLVYVHIASTPLVSLRPTKVTNVGSTTSIEGGENRACRVADRVAAVVAPAKATFIEKLAGAT